MSTEMRTNVKEQLRLALMEGDAPKDLVCMYQPLLPKDKAALVAEQQYGALITCHFDDLPEYEYNASFGALDGEPAIAFSARYVYIRVQNNLAASFEAIPRTPEHVTSPLPWPGR